MFYTWYSVICLQTGETICPLSQSFSAGMACSTSKTCLCAPVGSVKPSKTVPHTFAAAATLRTDSASSKVTECSRQALYTRICVWVQRTFCYERAVASQVATRRRSALKMACSVLLLRLLLLCAVSLLCFVPAVELCRIGVEQQHIVAGQACKRSNTRYCRYFFVNPKIYCRLSVYRTSYCRMYV